MSKDGGGSWERQKALASGYYTKGPDMTIWEGERCDHLVIIMIKVILASCQRPILQSDEKMCSHLESL